MRLAVFATTLVLLFFLASCATTPDAPPAVPEWDAVPAGVVEALCQRLRNDGLASGSVAIVRITQPLVTPATVAALAGSRPRQRARGVEGPFMNRAIPVVTGGSSCEWKPIEATDTERHRDEIVVELSAPVADPYAPGEAGMFARATLAGEYPSWYWISLIPQKGGWSVRFVYVLAK